MARRREVPVSSLRVTTHAIRVLEKMRDLKVPIHYDEDTCVLLTDPNRKLSHKAVTSLRTMRLIRPRDYDTSMYVLTSRAHELLAIDSRSRPKDQEDTP